MNQVVYSINKKGEVWSQLNGDPLTNFHHHGSSNGVPVRGQELLELCFHNRFQKYSGQCYIEADRKSFICYP